MTFAKLVHTFAEECQLSESMATSANCIAELMDEVLDCDEYNTFPHLFKLLLETNLKLPYTIPSFFIQ